jgi:hypothetical protein
LSAVQPATKIPSCPTAETGLTADTTATPHETRIVVPVALAAVGFTIAYFLSDLIEVVQGDFSTLRLLLTYLGEAAIPLFVMGLYAVQRPRIGRLGLVGAAAFAYSYVFFTGTVIYALIARTPNYRALSSVLAGWMTLHGLIMVAGGVCFGLAVVRAGVLPRWSGACLMVGVLLVAAASPLPNIARTAAAAFPDTAFIGMGLALLVQHRGTGSQTGDAGAHRSSAAAQATALAGTEVLTGVPVSLSRRGFAGARPSMSVEIRPAKVLAEGPSPIP